MKKYEIIDHTADIGVRVFGRNLEDLFVNAATALTGLLFEPFRSSEGKSTKINISAVDKEQLLVKWLREILYLFESEKIAPMAFEILSLSEKELAAIIRVAPFNPEKYRILHQIKAVTYHNLAIKKHDRHLEVTVIFDV